jgi:RNA polymerase sigma-70 factor (ECF subfamily)
VRNRAIDELRRMRRQQPLHMAMSDDTSSQHTAASAVVLDIFAQQEVREAVAALPALHREALLLAFFHGLSHQEISIRLQTPLGTIKARIRRALLTLRQQLLEKESLS